MRRIGKYVAAIYRAIAPRARIERLIAQSVLALTMCFALSRFIDTALPYPVFLFCGLAPWFYFSELLRDLPGQPAAFAVHFAKNAHAPFKLSFLQALACLPTLLFWMVAAILAHLFLGGAIASPLLLLYLVLCNFYNAIMQGILLCTLAALMRQGIGAGLSVTLPFLFWTTPIAWPMGNASGVLLMLAYGNPLYYFAEGFRTALAYGQLPQPLHTLIFFVAATIMGIIGLLCMGRVWRKALGGL